MCAPTLLWRWLLLPRLANPASRAALPSPLIVPSHAAPLAAFEGVPAVRPRGVLTTFLDREAPFILPTPWARPPQRGSRGWRTTGCPARFGRTQDHSFLVAGLHRFGEQLSGASFNLLIFRNLLEAAEPRWLLEVFFLHSRLAQLFSLSRGRGGPATPLTQPTHPWYGGAQIIVSAVCSRDPSFVTQWAQRRMATMRLFAHRRFLRLLGSFLRGYVDLTSHAMTIRGFCFVTTGKISVTGNAMSRTMLVRVGKAGVNNLSYRATSAFTLIRTKTGCLGLNLTFYY